MVIPVVWANNNPNAIARHYWDQGMLEALLDRSLWRPPGALEFEHNDPEDPEAAARHDWIGDLGAVVVVPARHNTKEVRWLNDLIRPLPWVLLVMTGDEEAAFPWYRIEHPRMKVWGMGARPGRRSGVDQPLGSGWPPWFPALLSKEPPVADELLDWCFAGQVTHERRRACIAALPNDGPGVLLETESFTAGFPPEGYAAFMEGAKIAPCPSGPMSPDSFRLYEALEAGCIPIADAADPANGPDPAYWTYVMGEPPPFPQIADWETLPALMEEQLAGWPENANKIGAWWSQWKRRLAHRFEDDLVELSGSRRVIAPDEEITVIIPVSPSPLHPSVEHLEATVASVRAHLPASEIIVAADPPRPELEHRRGDWDEFVRRALWRAQRAWSNVVVMLREEWGHEANVVVDALELVRTPLILLVEYDAPLVAEREIRWESCVRAIHSGRANMIRFSHEAGIIPEHKELMLGSAERIEGIDLIPTMQYSSRPHLAPAWLYRDIFERWFNPGMRTMIEDPLYGIVNAEGPEAWERWRIWIYAEASPDGSIQRSLHLDGRRDDPKFEMRY